MVPTPTATSQPARRRILVVDDDPDSAESFAMLLRQFGHEVEIATDPQGVVELACRTHPDLIFLDIGMPGTDGWEVARRLRRELGEEGVRIVAVTGYAEREDYRRSRQAGFDAHVAKPVDMALVESILAEIR